MSKQYPTANMNRGTTLFCDQSVLDTSQRKRRELLHEWLQVGICDIIERPNGYAFCLDPDCRIDQYAEEFIALEQCCCPFLRCHMSTDEKHNGPVLEVGGAEGVKEFVAAHFGTPDHAG